MAGEPKVSTHRLRELASSQVGILPWSEVNSIASELLKLRADKAELLEWLRQAEVTLRSSDWPMRHQLAKRLADLIKKHTEE